MIVRPEQLTYVVTFIELNFVNFYQLEIDLEHVNKNTRSDLSDKDVQAIVKLLLHGQRLEASDERTFGDEVCSYFVITGKYDHKVFKLVFCICSDKPQTIGIITLYRVKDKK